MDWIALVFTLLGRLLIAKRSIFAFAAFVVGDVLWALWAFPQGLFSLLIVNLVFLAADLYGWCKWVKDGRLS
jgi:nicotinamide riboside transporter PnuC